MPTIKEIARMAGVSRGTVDRVLNNRGTVKAATAEKVRAIAEAVNYAPNRAGKTLAVTKRQLKFGYVLFSNTSDNSFFADVVRGIEDRAERLKEYGASVALRFAAIDKPALQVKLIDELVAEGIDGLAIAPINHPAVARRLKMLTEAGLPVVTTNSDLPDCGRMAYVGSDYYKSGETAAGLMNLVCGGAARVGVILGSPLVLCHSQRVAGFTARARAAYPGISIVATAVNNDNDDESFAQTGSMLRQHPEIDALFLAAAGVPGACRAVEAAGLRGRVRVIGYDVTPPICALLEQGAIVATISQQPFTQGAKPLDILLDCVGMGVPPERELYHTKIEIKIRENL